MAFSLKSRFGLASFAAIWTLAVAAGLYGLLDYGASPAEGGFPARAWPERSTLYRQPGRPTLVMLAHPQCPCSRASLEELAIVAAQTEGRLDIHVVFLSSPRFEFQSDLWYSASEIPGATVSEDADGTVIRRFGVQASGHALVYDATGRLIYSGGVTSSRGHAGGNRGREAIIEIARVGRTVLAEFPVFGCALQNSRGTVSVEGEVLE